MRPTSCYPSLGTFGNKKWCHFHPTGYRRHPFILRLSLLLGKLSTSQEPVSEHGPPAATTPFLCHRSVPTGVLPSHSTAVLQHHRCHLTRLSIKLCASGCRRCTQHSSSVNLTLPSLHYLVQGGGSTRPASIHHRVRPACNWYSPKARPLSQFRSPDRQQVNVRQPSLNASPSEMKPLKRRDDELNGQPQARVGFLQPVLSIRSLQCRFVAVD